MRWTEQETARLAYLVDNLLEKGYNVSEACEEAAISMERNYNSCHGRYNYKVKYREQEYIQKYLDYIKEHQNKNYSIFVNGKEIDIVLSEPTIIIAQDGDLSITVKIKE
jgi:hypothetical protein